MTDRETVTLSIKDVAVLNTSTVVPPRAYSLSELKVGMDVVFIDHRLNCHAVAMVNTPHETNAAALGGKLARIIAIEPNRPGKQVALCFKEKIAFGHSCDDRVPEGHGAYVLAEHLYSVEAYTQHHVNHLVAEEEQVAIDAMLKGFFTP